MQEEKKYYWVKLNKDFFKDYKITILESMPNGKEYILIYLKLICESTSHNGELKFDFETPYTSETLAYLFHTDLEVMKQAMEIFQKHKLIHILEDGTIVLDEVKNMIGFETKYAQKMRAYRENKSAKSEEGKGYNVAQNRLQCSQDVDQNRLQCSQDVAQNRLQQGYNVRQESKSIRELDNTTYFGSQDYLRSSIDRDDKDDRDDKGILAFTKNAKIIKKLLSLGFISLEDKTEIFSIDNWLEKNISNYDIEDFKVALAYFLKKVPSLKNVKSPSAYFVKVMKSNLRPEEIEARKNDSKHSGEEMSKQELESLLEDL